VCRWWRAISTAISTSSRSRQRLKAQDGAGVVIYQGGGSKLGLPASGRLARGADPGHGCAHRRQGPSRTSTPRRSRSGWPRRSSAARTPSATSPGCASSAACVGTLVGALRQHCPRLRFRVPAGSYYLWVTLPAPLTVETLLPVALEHGVGVRSGTAFSPNGGGLDHIRLCCGAPCPIGSWRAPAGSGGDRAGPGTAHLRAHATARVGRSRLSRTGSARRRGQLACREAERARPPLGESPSAASTVAGVQRPTAHEPRPSRARFRLTLRSCRPRSPRSDRTVSTRSGRPVRAGSDRAGPRTTAD
jgi:hypothetical protein